MKTNRDMQHPDGNIIYEKLYQCVTSDEFEAMYPSGTVFIDEPAMLSSQMVTRAFIGGFHAGSWFHSCGFAIVRA